MKKGLIGKTLLCCLTLSQAMPLFSLSSCSSKEDLVGNINGTDWKGVNLGEFGLEDRIIDQETKTVTYTCGIAIHAFDLIIPDYVTYEKEKYKVLLAEGCFENCLGLSGSVELNKFSKHIPDRCFQNCYNLTAVFCREYPTRIGDFAFAGCILLVQIKMRQKTHLSNDWAMKLRYIGEYAFSNAWLDGDLVFGNNLQYIGNYAFNECHKITSVDLRYSNSLFYINNGVFRGCDNIKTVTLPTSVTYIGNEAFTYCVWLETVNFPSSGAILSLGNKVFQQCQHFTGFKPACRFDKIGDSCFAFNTNISFTPWSKQYGLDYITPSAFSSCGYSSLVFEPNHPKDVGDSAFSDCPNLSSLDFSAFGPNDKVPSWSGKHIFAGTPEQHGTIYISDGSLLEHDWIDFLKENDIIIDHDHWTIREIGGEIQHITPPKEKIVITTLTEGVGRVAFDGFSYESLGYVDPSLLSITFEPDIEGTFEATIKSFDRDNKTFGVMINIAISPEVTRFSGKISIFYDNTPILIRDGEYGVVIRQ